MFRKIFEARRKKQNSIKSANLAYGALVAQARKPVFYTTHAVADTIDGRFDMVALHLFIVLRRLDTINGGQDMQQHLADITIADMDQSVREMGVGDTGVSKRIMAMAQAFWGRFEAYKHATNETMVDAIVKNVFRGDSSKAIYAQNMAKYVESQLLYLSKQSEQNILKGNIKFND